MKRRRFQDIVRFTFMAFGLLLSRHPTECFLWTTPTSRASTTTNSVTSRLWASESSSPDDDNEEPPTATVTQQQQQIILKQQAAQLRQEADALRRQLEQERATAVAKQNAKVDAWIQQLLLVDCDGGGDETTTTMTTTNNDTVVEVLRDVDQVMTLLQEKRFSQEQVTKIFNRICEESPQSRSRCSPLMETLVDAVGKLDAVERKDNPNKRWSGKVERRLRKRLFAMDWGMDLEDEDEDDAGNPWKLN